MDKEEHILRNEEDTIYPQQKTTFNEIITKTFKSWKNARKSSVYFRAMIAVFLSKSLRLTQFYGGKGAVLFLAAQFQTERISMRIFFT